MLDSILKLLGFKRRDSLEQHLEHYNRLSSSERDEVLDVYGKEDLRSSPPDQLAQSALNLWRNGRHKDALDYYNRAIELAPTDSTLLLNRGNLYFELGDISAAVIDFERAMHGKPKLPDHVFVNYQMIQTLGEDSPVLSSMIERRRQKQQQP